MNMLVAFQGFFQGELHVEVLRASKRRGKNDNHASRRDNEMKMRNKNRPYSKLGKAGEKQRNAEKVGQVQRQKKNNMEEMYSNILEIKILTQTLQWKDIKCKNVKKKLEVKAWEKIYQTNTN